MGKARDGSNCYTRENKAGGKYITCEGQQKADRKLQREISKLHGRTRVKVTKDEFEEARLGLQQAIAPSSAPAIPQVREERVDLKVRQLDQRSWKSGKGKAKNPHKWIQSLPDGRASSEGLLKVIQDYESGVLSKTEVNTVIYKASQIILSEREAEGALAGLQTETEQQIDDITSQAHTQLGELFDAHVAEAPGVVGMTTNMTGLELATFDALMGMGQDVAKRIQAAVAARTPYAILNEKAKKGTLEYQEFFEYLMDEDDDFSDTLYGNITDRMEVFSYNMDYWVHQVNEDADTWVDLDEDESQELHELMRDEASDDQEEHLKSVFNEYIRGKKFNSLDEAIKLFKKELDYYFA